MTRWWNGFLADVDDRIGLGLVTLLLFVAAALVAAGWYFWPKWLPTRWPRRARSDEPRRKWRWAKVPRRRRGGPPEEGPGAAGARPGAGPPPTPGPPPPPRRGGPPPAPPAPRAGP